MGATVTESVNKVNVNATMAGSDMTAGTQVARKYLAATSAAKGNASAAQMGSILKVENARPALSSTDAKIRAAETEVALSASKDSSKRTTFAKSVRQ